MIKQKTVLEITKDERIYSFECSPDSPLGELYDILTRMRAFVFERIQEEENKTQKSPTE